MPDTARGGFQNAVAPRVQKHRGACPWSYQGLRPQQPEDTTVTDETKPKPYPYHTVPTRIRDNVPKKLERLAAALAKQYDGLKVSNAHAVNVAVDEALAKRGIK